LSVNGLGRGGGRDRLTPYRSVTYEVFFRLKTFKKACCRTKFCQNTLVMEIKVYYNRHKRCLSIQEKVDGAWRVVRHAEQCIVKNAKFKVSEAGRQRVLKEQRKNVHAVILGENLGQIAYSSVPKASVSYNPYKAKTFVDEHNNPIHEAEIVVIRGNKNGYAIFAE